MLSLKLSIAEEIHRPLHIELFRNKKIVMSRRGYHGIVCVLQYSTGSAVLVSSTVFLVTLLRKRSSSSSTTYYSTSTYCSTSTSKE